MTNPNAVAAALTAELQNRFAGQTSNIHHPTPNLSTGESCTISQSIYSPEHHFSLRGGSDFAVAAMQCVL